MYDYCKTCRHDDGDIGFCDKCGYLPFHKRNGLPPTEYEKLTEPRVLTNADRIRAMSDEELADLYMKAIEDEEYPGWWGNRMGLLAWLKAEATW